MKISIEQTPEGFEVETEQEMPSMPGAMGAEQEMGQTFATIDEALDYVRSQLGGNAAEQPKPMMEGEAEFVGGFKKARGMEQGF